MERKLWHEQQTQKCALTSIGLLIEGLSSSIFLRTSGKLWAGPDVDAQRELRMFLERGREACFWL